MLPEGESVMQTKEEGGTENINNNKNNQRICRYFGTVI